MRYPRSIRNPDLLQWRYTTAWHFEISIYPKPLHQILNDGVQREHCTCTDRFFVSYKGRACVTLEMQWCRGQTGAGGCGLDGTVNVIGERGPRREGLKIGPRIRAWSRFIRTMCMNTGGPEFSLSVVCEREIWEAGLHFQMTGARARRAVITCLKIGRNSSGPWNGHQPKSFSPNLGKSYTTKILT